MLKTYLIPWCTKNARPFDSETVLRYVHNWARDFHIRRANVIAGGDNVQQCCFAFHMQSSAYVCVLNRAVNVLRYAQIIDISNCFSAHEAHQ